MHSTLITCAALLFALPIYGTPASHYADLLLGRSDDPSPRTGDVLNYLESTKGVDWTEAKGGNLAFISHDDWNEAHAGAVKKLKAKRELEGSSLNERNTKVLFRRGGTTISGGENGKAATYNCFGSGQWAYNQGVSAIFGTGCAAAFETIQAGATGQWVWTSPQQTSPDNNKVKIILRVTFWAAKTLTITQCAAFGSNIFNSYCTGSKSDATGDDSKFTSQGGYESVFSGDANSWFGSMGSETARITVDPNNANNDD